MPRLYRKAVVPFGEALKVVEPAEVLGSSLTACVDQVGRILQLRSGTEPSLGLRVSCDAERQGKGVESVLVLGKVVKWL
jgi:hypothetical protein